MNKRIGIIGGTFNPIHIAHLIIAETFFYQLKLDYCYFVPALISPFKKDQAEDLVLPEHRLEMLKLSLKDNNKFGIETFEINNKEISYSIRTVEYFAAKYSEDNLFFLIGDDQAGNFDKWKDWREIIETVQLCIAKRQIGLKTDEVKKINEKLSINNKFPVWLENPLMEISSEAIRERIKNNKPIKYLVTKEVELYIRDNDLYK